MARSDRSGVSLRVLLAGMLGLLLAGCDPSGGVHPPPAGGTPSLPPPAGGTPSLPPPIVSPPSPPPAPLPPAPPSVERMISPAATGPGIAATTGDHVAINPDPAVPARGRLFVMLPGSGGVPRLYRLVVRTGPPRGYHAIGLAYANAEAVNVLCARSIDPDCTARVRQEILFGEPASPLVDVDAANSVVGRLSALLATLDRLYPDEGWGQFLVAGRPDWRRITVAGHSQGGGHAAFLAKAVELDRAVMFAAPGDGAGAGQLAPWLFRPNVTPAERLHGFIHTADDAVPLQRALNAWNALGMAAFGPPVSVDAARPPFAGSRQLLTSAAPRPDTTGLLSETHGAPVVDAVTPLDAAGEPLFMPVWIHMAFP